MNGACGKEVEDNAVRDAEGGEGEGACGGVCCVVEDGVAAFDDKWRVGSRDHRACQGHHLVHCCERVCRELCCVTPPVFCGNHNGDFDTHFVVAVCLFWFACLCYFILFFEY